MSDEMSSKNSNNSDIEVIGPEDLEESPPPTDAAENETEQTSTEKKEENSEVQSQLASDGDKLEESIGEVKEVESDNVSAGAAAIKDDDDPPIEVMGAPAPAEPAVAAPAVDLEDLGPAARPVVTAARPAATLEEVEEDDDEEDDDDIDETLVERLVGLTEMFPDFVRCGTVGLVNGSVSLSKWSYSMSRTVSWIVFSSAALLFMPVMIETERLQIQDQQKAQKSQILLGPGAAASGGPSIGPPPI